MDTERLAAAYLDGLVRRLATVLGVLAVLYVLGTVWTTTEALEKPIDVGEILTALGANLPILAGLLAVGTLYSVIKPAFRPSDRTVARRGKDPGEVPTAIKIGENSTAYLVQSAVRAALLVPLGVGLVVAWAVSESGGPLSVSVVLSALAGERLLYLVGAVALALIVSLTWPYTEKSSSSSGGDADGGE